MAIGKTNALALLGPQQPATSGNHKVYYVDVDGTLLNEQWVNSGENAVLPAINPNYDSERLTFKGYTLENNNVNEDRVIGPLYDTVDGKTYCNISLTINSGLEPTLNILKSDDSTLTIDWGDETTTDYNNTGSIIATHLYSQVGIYWVRIWISSGEGTYRLSSNFFGGSSQAYKNALLKCYIGIRVENDFYQTFLGNQYLRVVTSPYPMLSKYRTFYNNYSLLYAYNSTLMDIEVFRNNYSIRYISSDIVGGQGNPVEEYLCQNNYSLRTLNIPSGRAYIYQNAFENNYNLERISLKSNIIAIYTNVFKNCFNLREIKIYRSLPSITTLASTNVFLGIHPECKIYVPDVALNDYKTATNWATYANYIYPLSDIGE